MWAACPWTSREHPHLARTGAGWPPGGSVHATAQHWVHKGMCRDTSASWSAAPYSKVSPDPERKLKMQTVWRASGTWHRIIPSLHCMHEEREGLTGSEDRARANSAVSDREELKQGQHSMTWAPWGPLLPPAGGAGCVLIGSRSPGFLESHNLILRRKPVSFKIWV